MLHGVRGRRSFDLAAELIGGVGAVGGGWVYYRQDLRLGPGVTSVGCGAMLVSKAVRGALNELAGGAGLGQAKEERRADSGFAFKPQRAVVQFYQLLDDR